MEIYKFVRNDVPDNKPRYIKGSHFLDCVEQLRQEHLHEVSQINITILYRSEGHYAYVDLDHKRHVDLEGHDARVEIHGAQRIKSDSVKYDADLVKSDEQAPSKS